ncbi:MAG: tRNA (adenosine(37)-N6)-threonylcarbamoyltransferase complex ATPase subunit type 1 TsaE [Bacillota bacterium]
MKFVSKSILETYALAKEVAKKLKGGEIITLEGDLGAGKTTFTKGLARALEVNEEILSPTFIMMREYKGKFTIYHYDLYRITDEEELEELGIKENLYDDNSISVIEWNKFKDLPKDPIKIKIKRIDDNTRSFEIK